MKKILAYLLFIFSTYLSDCQIITVVDKFTKSPLDMVAFSSKQPLIYSTTNSKGEINISSFNGIKTINIRLPKYVALQVSYEEISTQTKLYLEPINIDIEKIVISANRFKQLSSSIPSKIETLSPKNISLHNPQTAADLLNFTGKVFVQKSQQGGGSPMINGFATNRLLYTIDGIRMNTAIFRSGNVQNVISIDPLSIENLEILFGPGSLNYGSDAIGGVMNFQTLIAELSASDKPFFMGNALTRYSSANNEKTAHFDINLGWKKFALLTSISTNNYEDLTMGEYGPKNYLRHNYIATIDSTDVVMNNKNPKIQIPSGYKQINMMQKIRYKPNNNWDIRYGFHYSETSNYDRYDRHIRYKNKLPKYAEWKYGPQIWIMNNFCFSNYQNTYLYDKMDIRIAQQYFEESRISRKFNKNDRKIRTEKVDAYSLNADFIKNISAKNMLFYGLELVSNKVNSLGENINIKTNTITPASARYPKSTWASYGIYISDKYTISKQFIVQAGIRYNKHLLNSDFDTTFYRLPFTEAKVNDGKFTGNIGFVFKPTKKIIISSNFATGFRSPNVDDIGKIFDSEPGSVVVPNPNLKAEYAYNTDFRIVKMFGNFMKLDFSIYYTVLKDALVRRDFMLENVDSIMYDGTLSKIQAIQNAAKVNVYGIQVGVKFKILSGFGASIICNFQKGTEELDNKKTSPARHVPPLFATAKIFYEIDNINMQFYSIYNAKRDFDNMPESEKNKPYLYAIDNNGNPFSPDWYTINFKTMYKISNFITISAGLENITNQLYRPYSSGISAPGRNFIMAIKIKF